MSTFMMYQPLTSGSLIDHAARYHADTEIVSVNTRGGTERTTWQQVAHNAHRVASALDHLGVPSGARCATLAWNNRRHLEIYFGVGAGGRVTHTVNPRLSDEHLIYILNDAEDDVLFFDFSFCPLIQRLRPHLKTVKHYVLMEPHTDDIPEELAPLLFFDELLEHGDKNHRWPEFSETTPASLCYTSGTTGMPKGVLNTHRSLVLHTLSSNQPDGTGISARDCLLPVVPMFHVNAWGTPFIAAMVGARLVLPGAKLDGESLLQLLSSECITVAFGVPVIWANVLEALQNHPRPLPHFRRSFVGGAALSPAMTEIFETEHRIELVHAWGMTETSPIGTINAPLHRPQPLTEAHALTLKSGQGRPVFGIDLRLVDADGQTLPSDGKTRGYLQVRGHWVVGHYFNQDKSALTEDGWFDTGDIGTLDEHGYLILCDRAKDIIKSGGEWISTVELENVAVAHPEIQRAAAIGVTHPKWDERPVLICVRKSGSEVDEAALHLWFQARVPKWQIPDKILFIDTLPMSATGKVLKNELRHEYGQILMGART
ncbi:long-chain-fatty-acid--CoA ligase [Enterobacteriaceae bacterium RIT691]|nr:long-chain-fatty-acid--CoA ligase [Enterobacteriaceae bacterium RIT691]